MEGGVSGLSGGQFKLAADAGCVEPLGCRHLQGSPTSFQGQSGTHLFGRYGNRTRPKQSIFRAPIPGEKLQEEIHFEQEASKLQQRHFLRSSSSTRSLSLLEAATPASSIPAAARGPFATLFSPVSHCRPARRRDLSFCGLSPFAVTPAQSVVSRRRRLASTGHDGPECLLHHCRRYDTIRV